MHSPRVSVIVTCYNLGRYLDEAVESVLAQSFQDFEILVVDDGSTDPDTCRLLAAYHKPRTRVVHSDNKGLPAARNLGVVHTTGRYISALDADDRFEPTWLERAVALLDADPSLAFVSHWLKAFGEEGWDWRPVRCDLASLLDSNSVNGAALVRRSVVEAVGGFDESMRDGCEDWEFWIRVTERGYRGAIIPETLYRYRRRSDSMSWLMNLDETHMRLYAELIEKHPDSYRRHLLDLVLRRERTFSELCRHVDSLEEELRTWLEPALEERRCELDRARARLAEIEARQALENDRRMLAERVDDLHRSLSWRLTAPLRRIYAWLGFGNGR